MPSIPLTPDEEKHVLQRLGLSSVDDLFSRIPPRVRETADFHFDTDHGMGEHELRQFFGNLSRQNEKHHTHFVGGGVYDNVIPAIVNQLALRGEFLTCYTPYQPEISQGTLTAIFEFQTLISRITAMPVSNASMYDGATATAEAITMAGRLQSKPDGTVLVAGSLSPDYLAVTRTFLKGHAKAPVTIQWTDEGTVDLDHLKSLIKTHDPFAVVIGQPNYFGIVEDLEAIRALVPCLLIVSSHDPSAFGIFEAPGKLGADIVCGEAHQFGTPMTFGGPHVGFLATRKEFVRQMPGRIVGETVDAKGQRAYTLTLSTREQHIRREKATSNICTNQGLIALRTAIYLSFLGKQGLVELAEINYSLFDYLKASLEKVGIGHRFGGTYYREGVFEISRLDTVFQKALSAGIIPGIRLQREWGDDFTQSILICAHPKLDRDNIDRLIEVLGG